MDLHLWVDLKLIVEADAVFAEEVEDDRAWWLEGNVLKLQRAAADSVSFVVAFFIASTQGKFVNKVHCGSKLTICHDSIRQVLLIVLANSANMLLQLSGFLEFLVVRLTFDVRVGCEHDILVRAID